MTVVPGNHDAWLPSVHAERRFLHHFGAFLKSDLPGLACELTAGPFPSVKLRGPVAVIALSSAVPRPPFIASGRVGTTPLAALQQIVTHPEVSRRTPVVLVHHPPVERPGAGPDSTGRRSLPGHARRAPAPRLLSGDVVHAARRTCGPPSSGRAIRASTLSAPGPEAMIASSPPPIATFLRNWVAWC